MQGNDPKPRDPFAHIRPKPRRGDSTGVDEAAFRRWYTEQAARTGLASVPDDPRHFYDYRAAFAAGAPGGARTRS